MYISQRHINTIQRRIDFLTRLIDDSNGDMGYEKAELSALQAAIQHIDDEQANVHQDRAFRNGQKVILKYYKKRLSSAVSNGDVEALQLLLDKTNEWLEQSDS